LDLVGLHFVITRILGKTDSKYLVAAIGWTSAELVVTKFVIQKIIYENITDILDFYLYGLVHVVLNLIGNIFK
jgi:hypothetical protein